MSNVKHRIVGVGVRVMHYVDPDWTRHGYLLLKSGKKWYVYDAATMMAQPNSVFVGKTLREVKNFIIAKHETKALPLVQGA